MILNKKVCLKFHYTVVPEIDVKLEPGDEEDEEVFVL